MSGGPADPALETLLDEVRLLWNVIVGAGERLHAREPVTLGMRAVLEALLRRGPATVPALARARRVTRQHIQALVNALLENGLVELVPNPAHRRSPLVALTRRGESVIRRLKAKEAALFAKLAGPPAGELRRAAATLRAVRRAFEDTG